MHPYDAVLLISFGGPERTEEVLPFLRSVTAGRGIPDERLELVGSHYLERGGLSPINAENRALRAALHDELARRGVDVPVIWGNRHLEPSVATALRLAQETGARRVVAVLTSAYPGYSGCRQYREDLAAASTELGGPDTGAGAGEAGVPLIDKIRPYATHPGFAGTMARLVRGKLAELMAAGTGPGEPPVTLDHVRLVFVAHSIPVAYDESSGPPGRGGRQYSGTVSALAATLARTAAGELRPQDPALAYDVAYCSRSGAPGQPWLEPDVNDLLATLPDVGVRAVVLVPLGFVADHMEVVYDLDTQAAATAADLGLLVRRAPTVRTDPEFVAGLVDLIFERAAQERGEPMTLATWPDQPHNAGAAVPDPLPAVCADGCCPNLRGAKPALCGAGR